MAHPATDLVVVGPTGTRYPVPDLAKLDEHITGLYARILRADEHTPIAVARLWDDVDTLLEYRLVVQGRKA